MTDFRARTDVLSRGVGRLLTQYRSDQRLLAKGGLRGAFRLGGAATRQPSLIPYLTTDIHVPYLWTFNGRTGAGRVPNEGEHGSMDLIPQSGPTVAYSSAGGLDGDYVVATPSGNTPAYLSQGGIAEMYDMGGGLANMYMFVVVFKPTHGITSNSAVVGIGAPVFANPFRFYMSYQAASPTVLDLRFAETGFVLSDLVWGEWNVLFVRYKTGGIEAALNLGTAHTLVGGGIGCSSEGTPIAVVGSRNDAPCFDDPIDTVAIYTNDTNNDHPFQIDRPQIYGRIMARQPLYRAPPVHYHATLAGAFALNGAATAIPVSDPDFASVVLLAHMDTTGWVDSSGRHTLTPHGSPTNPAGQFSNALGCNGNAGLTTEASNDWQLGGDYTIELTVHEPSTPTANRALIGNYGSAGTNNGAWVLARDASQVYLYVEGVGFPAIAWASPMPVGTNKIALVRHGSSTVLYVNGTMVASTTSFINMTGPTYQLGIGCDNSGTSSYWIDWIDEVRITKGVARYTGASYIVAGGPFPNS